MTYCRDIILSEFDLGELKDSTELSYIITFIDLLIIQYFIIIYITIITTY